MMRPLGPRVEAADNDDDDGGGGGKDLAAAGCVAPCTGGGVGDSEFP